MNIVWITGASSGIGLATAKKFLNENYKVVISSRNIKKLEKAKQKLLSNSKNKEIYFYPCDISKREEVKKTVSKITIEIGYINLGILNAAAYSPNKSQIFSIENYEYLIDVNLKGTLYCIESLIEKMNNKNNKHIAIIASPVGYRGLPTSAAYGATKAALINMCEALKPEFDQYNIDLTLVNPGFVKTPLTDKNTFYMPFLLSPKEAASLILSGAKKKKFEITFPFGFAIFMKLLRILPYKLYFFLTQWMIQDEQQKK